jgi:hypothetical protein
MRLYGLIVFSLLALETNAHSQDFKNSSAMRQISDELRQIRMLLEKNIDKPISTVTPSINLPPGTPLRTVSVALENTPMMGSKAGSLRQDASEWC